MLTDCYEMMWFLHENTLWGYTKYGFSPVCEHAFSESPTWGSLGFCPWNQDSPPRTSCTSISLWRGTTCTQRSHTFSALHVLLAKKQVSSSSPSSLFSQFLSLFDYHISTSLWGTSTDILRYSYCNLENFTTDEQLKGPWNSCSKLHSIHTNSVGAINSLCITMGSCGQQKFLWHIINFWLHSKSSWFAFRQGKNTYESAG